MDEVDLHAAAMSTPAYLLDGISARRDLDDGA